MRKLLCFIICFTILIGSLNVIAYADYEKNVLFVPYQADSEAEDSTVEKICDIEFFSTDTEDYMYVAVENKDQLYVYDVTDTSEAPSFVGLSGMQISNVSSDNADSVEIVDGFLYTSRTYPDYYLKFDLSNGVTRENNTSGGVVLWTHNVKSEYSLRSNPVDIMINGDMGYALYKEGYFELYPTTRTTAWVEQAKEIYNDQYANPIEAIKLSETHNVENPGNYQCFVYKNGYIYIATKNGYVFVYKLNDDYTLTYISHKAISGNDIAIDGTSVYPLNMEIIGQQLYISIVKQGIVSLDISDPESIGNQSYYITSEGQNKSVMNISAFGRYLLVPSYSSNYSIFDTLENVFVEVDVNYPENDITALTSKYYNGRMYIGAQKGDSALYYGDMELSNEGYISFALTNSQLSSFEDGVPVEVLTELESILVGEVEDGIDIDIYAVLYKNTQMLNYEILRVSSINQEKTTPLTFTELGTYEDLSECYVKLFAIDSHDCTVKSVDVLPQSANLPDYVLGNIQNTNEPIVMEPSVNSQTYEVHLDFAVDTQSIKNNYFITITAPNDNVDYIDVLSPDANGKFALDFTISDGNRVSVLDYSVAIPVIAQTKTFHYYSEGDVDDALEMIYKADADTLYDDVLNANPYKDILSLNMSVYDTLSPDRQRFVLGDIAGNNYENLPDLKLAFSNAVNLQIILDEISNASVAYGEENSVEFLIDKYSDKLDVDLQSSPFKDLPKTEKNNIFESIIDISKRKTLSAQDLNDVFDTNDLIICLVNSASYYDMQNILEIYSDTIGISKYDTRFNKLSDDDQVYVLQTMVRFDDDRMYTSFDDIEEVYLNAIVKKEKAASNNSSGSGSSGRGSGSSGSFVVSGGSSVSQNIKPSNNTTPLSNTTVEPFSDINDVDWAKNEIIELYEKGVIDGVGNGKFNPDANVTREEFVKLLLGIIGVEIIQEDCEYNDVDQSAWYYNYVATATKLGIVNGIGDKIFGVGMPITREQMAVMTYRALQYKKVEVSTGNDVEYSDDISQYALSSVNAISKLNIMNGVGNGKFEGQAYATRAMAAKVIHKVGGVL